MTHTERLLGPARDEFLVAVHESNSIIEIMKRLSTTHRAVVRAARELKILLPDGNFGKWEKFHAARKTPLWLDKLTKKEHADYITFKSANYTRAEALKAVGRTDLIAATSPKVLSP